MKNKLSLIIGILGLIEIAYFLIYTPKQKFLIIVIFVILIAVMIAFEYGESIGKAMTG